MVREAPETINLNSLKISLAHHLPISLGVSSRRREPGIRETDKGNKHHCAHNNEQIIHDGLDLNDDDGIVRRRIQGPSRAFAGIIKARIRTVNVVGLRQV